MRTGSGGRKCLSRTLRISPDHFSFLFTLQNCIKCPTQTQLCWKRPKAVLHSPLTCHLWDIATRGYFPGIFTITQGWVSCMVLAWDALVCTTMSGSTHQTGGMHWDCARWAWAAGPHHRGISAHWSPKALQLPLAGSGYCQLS